MGAIQETGQHKTPAARKYIGLQKEGVFGELGFISVERFRDRVADLPAQRDTPFDAAQRPKL